MLIIATFAIGGSLCGYAGKKLMACTNIEKGIFWVLLYIIIIFMLWPICVIVISIPLGQFSFFKKYIMNIYIKMITHKNVEDNHKK